MLCRLADTTAAPHPAHRKCSSLQAAPIKVEAVFTNATLTVVSLTIKNIQMPPGGNYGLSKFCRACLYGRAGPSMPPGAA